MTTSLPIVLKTKKILLIGAGAVAKQKLEVLNANGYEPKIIASENLQELERVECRDVCIEDMQGFEIVIDATGSSSVREIVFSAKRRYGFLLNRVDEPEDCDFYFASLSYFGDLKVAVTTDGASPTIGQEVRDFIKRVLPKKLEDLTQRKKEARKNGQINVKETRQEVQKALGHVYLIGCGIGDVELLTLKAYRLIQEVDVVFVDHLISQEIKDIIPEGTKQVFVGKEKGRHSVNQDEINRLLLEYANKGLRIARLKSGDPYIFGRGAEEAMFLAEKGLRVDVVPGISSAISAPLSAGIAPTARGYAASVSIVTAHLKDSRINIDWIDLLKMKNHTTIVLMSVSRADEIVKAALEIGASKDLPAAIISNASRPNQEVFTTNLEGLVDLAKDAPRPALIVFGEVVNLYGSLPIFKAES